MQVRLVNRTVFGRAEISGTVFHFRQLDAGDKIEMKAGIDISALPEFKITDANILRQIIGRAVTSVEGFDLPPAKIVMDLADFGDLAALFAAVLSYSALTEDEIKNYEASLSGKAMEETPIGSSRATLSEAAVAADINALADGK